LTLLLRPVGFVTSLVSRGSSCIGTDPRHQPPMLATAIHVVAAAGLGAVAGLLGGLFGVGGGFLVIPLLGFFYGMDQQTAQGTALIMVVPNVLCAFSRYQRRFGIDLRMAATIAGSALIATYPTARLASSLDPYLLRLAFAIFLGTTAGRVAGLCRGRSGRLACRITACIWRARGDFSWCSVRQPPARETDAARILRALGAYRGAAGATGLIESGGIQKISHSRVVASENRLRIAGILSLGHRLPTILQIKGE